MTTHAKNFDKVWDLFDKNVVYVIPTFQRPYAWEESQISDLLEDLNVTSRLGNGQLYMSPIHLVKIDSPASVIWQQYTDQENEDVKHLQEMDFQNAQGAPIGVYLVIDGQQRLATCFILLHILMNGYHGLSLSWRDVSIPKVILNPVEDHRFFRGLLGLPYNNPDLRSKSQIRLRKVFEYCGNPGVPMGEPTKSFVKGRNFTTLLVELDAEHALQTFLTLNDRGKDLTTLEKLKSLLMEYDCNWNPTPNPAPIHQSFGAIYRCLDREKCCVNENEFVQLAATDLWVHEDNDVPSTAADSLYESHFRVPSEHRGGAARYLHTKWLPVLRDLADQIDHLTGYLDGTNPSAHETSPLTQREVMADYLIVLDSLRLSLRTLAVLLKFRNMFGCEWHDTIGRFRFNNQGAKDLLFASMNDIDGKLRQLAPIPGDALLQKAVQVRQRINDIGASSGRDVSPLSIAELMELNVFKIGSVKPGNFAAAWGRAFDTTSTPELAAKEWCDFITCFRSRDKFIESLISRGPHSNYACYDYLLKEYEYNSYGTNVHLKPSLDIEHVFPQDPQAIQSDVTDFGFPYVQDYIEFSQTLGNRLILDSGLNRALANQALNVKAGAYVRQQYGRTVVPQDNQTDSSIELGNLLCSVQAHSRHEYRLFLRLRCLELVLFAVERF